MANLDFLGFGLTSPFQRDGSSDFASGSEVALVQAAIREVLGTTGDSPRASGELPWDTEFGSRLYLLKHRNLADIDEIAQAYVIEALRAFEPRVFISRVEVDKEEKLNQLRIRVFFEIIDENVPGNRVAAVSENVEVTI